jgi:hypothetical protein
MGTTQTDVKSGFCEVGATTVVTTNRARLKGMVISYPSGGTVVVTNGVGGDQIYEFTALAVIGSICITIPGEGILAPNGIAVTTAAATRVNIFYG